MIKRTLMIALVALAASQSVTVSAQTAAADAPDLKRGKLLYIQCRACHELKADQPHKVGPNLAGLLGSKGASAEDFTYSSALKAANLTWDLKTLDRWLEKPSAVVPGNAMAFAGIANPKDRASLLAYIVSETTAK
jgi:cytochrome c